MSIYIHPDEDLEWYFNGELIEGEKYTVSYSFGGGVGQFGGNLNQPSRVSTLYISQPQVSDSGTYTCAIRDTENSQDIQLTVIPGKLYYSVQSQQN